MHLPSKVVPGGPKMLHVHADMSMSSASLSPKLQDGSQSPLSTHEHELARARARDAPVVVFIQQAEVARNLDLFSGTGHNKAMLSAQLTQNLNQLQWKDDVF